MSNPHRKTTSTHEGLEYMCVSMAKAIDHVKKESGPLIALQSITFFFAGNPIVAFAEPTIKLACQTAADDVRRLCLKKFSAYGKPGPEAIERMFGDDKIWCVAAEEALLRFMVMLDVASEIVKQTEQSPIITA